MLGRLAVRAVALGVGMVLTACSGGSDPGSLFVEEASEQLPQLPPIPYAATVAGDMPAELSSLLRQLVDTASANAPPATSRLAIRQRGRADQAQLEQALRAEGYFDGSVRAAVREPSEVPPEGIAAELERLATPPEAVLVFDVVPGPRYRFGELRVELSDDPDGWQPPSPKELGLVEGEPALTKSVLDAETKLLDAARKAGFALARQGERDAIVDHESKRMDVVLRLQPGRRAVFGEVSFPGGDGIDPAFLRGRVPFATGQRYDPALVTEGQTNLFDTNLFSTIVPRPATSLGDAGQLDIAYDLRQRPPRTIGAEVNYETDIGPGGRLYWEHRNILGAGERFRIEASGSQPIQTLTAGLTKPDFLRPRQNLLLDATASRQRLEAYDSDSLGAGISVEREIRKLLKVSLGTALRYARIEDLKEPEQSYMLLSFPGVVDWDFANDRFDPTSGGTLRTTLTPFVDLLGTHRNFLRGRITHTRYFELSRAPQLVLAMRGSVGAMGGVSRDDIPADERFYAGGGGSIRGIGFELAGPLDDDDKPLGGRSLIEGSVELRTRFAENFGIAAFLDAGTVETSVFPSFEETVLFGAGPSFRYFTPIGPLRLDLGFPLNPRHGVDAPYQVYFSIGQAF